MGKHEGDEGNEYGNGWGVGWRLGAAAIGLVAGSALGWALGSVFHNDLAMTLLVLAGASAGAVLGFRRPSLF